MTGFARGGQFFIHSVCSVFCFCFWKVTASAGPAVACRAFCQCHGGEQRVRSYVEAELGGLTSDLSTFMSDFLPFLSFFAAFFVAFFSAFASIFISFLVPIRCVPPSVISG